MSDSSSELLGRIVQQPDGPPQGDCSGAPYAGDTGLGQDRTELRSHREAKGGQAWRERPLEDLRLFRFEAPGDSAAEAEGEVAGCSGPDRPCTGDLRDFATSRARRSLICAYTCTVLRSECPRSLATSSMLD